MIRASEGDTVTVKYSGRLTDGTLFDASPQDRPLRFILGRQEVIPGFEEGIEGMYQGESRTFTVPPEKAYGPREEKYVEEIERSVLPSDLDPVVGGQLEITHQNGDRLLVLVTAATEDTVTLDGNHPLAGRDLTFEVELVQVQKKPA